MTKIQVTHNPFGVSALYTRMVSADDFRNMYEVRAVDCFQRSRLNAAIVANNRFGVRK